MTHAADTTLADELAMVARGWSAQTYVESRAIAMRNAVQSGDHAKAERLAATVEALQRAECERHGSAVDIRKGCELWQLSAERWVEYLIGGYLVPRTIPVPMGCTPEEALAHIHNIRCVGPRTWPCLHIRLEDISRVSNEERKAA